MNFEQVDAVMGQRDGQYPKKVSMKGLADSPDAVQYSKDKGKPTQQVYITDGPGTRHRVKIVGNFPDITQLDLSQLLHFELWAYIADFDKKKYYMGFCNVPDDRTAPATEPTPDTRYDYKPKNQPTPAAKTPQRAPQAPDWDAKDERIVRQNTLNRAVELYIEIALKGIAKYEWPLPEKHKQSIKDLAEELRNYVYNGPSLGDQFAREQGLPTMEEDARRAEGRNLPPF